MRDNLRGGPRICRLRCWSQHEREHLGLIALLPVLAIVYGVTLVAAVTGRWTMPPALRAGVPVLTTVVVVVVLSWAYFALAGLPLRNALCPAGEPPWWPGCVPPSHDVYP